ncbi:hypothetical protein [Streptomyces albidocamelliae]|uniref:Uncharacterized protein n=1 Tax=Streptomyces albidocamelliae TaxID=2981135 RepID=A0ABY6F130_9ACTN|nr:hypothetical protein [Streptomyces sp. HUAS 14-6]UXY40379.1 hypothetical protein N8I86_38075 [Streptomyces sp. HUAS 14-6]
MRRSAPPQVLALVHDVARRHRQRTTGFQVVSGEVEAALPVDRPGRAPGGSLAPLLCEPDRPLATLTLAQLHTLDRLAASHRAVAREALKAADAAFTHLPGPVTSRAGHTHPAWGQRPMGDLSRHELASQLAALRRQMQRAQESHTLLSDTARHLIAALTREAQLRRALTARRATTAQRRRFARAALARADAVSDKIHAELRLRERLPDHAPHRPTHRGETPDWVADRHALLHPDTPAHWTTHLAERHRILARSLADRGHTLATNPPAWARRLPLPSGAATAGPSRPPWWNCGAAATPSPRCPDWVRAPTPRRMPRRGTTWTHAFGP